MSRKLFYFTAAATLLTFGACAQKQSPASTSMADRGSVDRVYSGVLPAADADGVRYTVLLDYDDDGNGGDYDMVETYFMTDSTGVNDIASFASEGDFTVGTSDSGQKYLKFDNDGAGQIFFVVDTDSTITLTDASLTPVATPGMNYTLKAAK